MLANSFSLVSINPFKPRNFNFQLKSAMSNSMTKFHYQILFLFIQFQVKLSQALSTIEIKMKNEDHRKCEPNSRFRLKYFLHSAVPYSTFNLCINSIEKRNIFKYFCIYSINFYVLYRFDFIIFYTFRSSPQILFVQFKQAASYSNHINRCWQNLLSWCHPALLLWVLVILNRPNGNRSIHKSYE